MDLDDLIPQLIGVGDVGLVQKVKILIEGKGFYEIGAIYEHNGEILIKGE